MSLTKDEFEAWKALPATRAVNRYLRDNAAEIRGEWSEGENWTDHSRVQVATWEEIADLDYESITGFYQRKAAEHEEERQRVLEEASQI